MSVATRLNQLIAAINWQIPAAPGTIPIPAGHVRLYHQTDVKLLNRIRKQGIKFEFSKSYDGPRAIWADEHGFYGKPDEKPTVEFHIDRSRWQHPPFVLGDVDPKDIIAIHYPWHMLLRSIDSQPEIIKDIMHGQHDDLLKDPYYGPAVRFIKHKYAGKIPSK